MNDGTGRYDYTVLYYYGGSTNTTVYSEVLNLTIYVDSVDEEIDPD